MEILESLPDFPGRRRSSIHGRHSEEDDRFNKLEKQRVGSQKKLDLAEWETLELTAAYADEMIKRTTESYLQTVAACQASAATAQANLCAPLTFI